MCIGKLAVAAVLARPQPLFATVGRSFMGPREVTAEQIGCLQQTPAELGFQPHRTTVRAFDDFGGAALRPSPIHDGSTRHRRDFSDEVDFQARP